MSLIRVNIELSNSTDTTKPPMTLESLVDHGTQHLCIPPHVALQLGFDLKNNQNQREVTTADGKQQLIPYVGPIKVGYKERSCFVGALVMGDECLFGTLPIEDMDLVDLINTNKDPKNSTDTQAIDYNLKLTPTERLNQHQSSLETVLELEKAHKKLYAKSPEKRP